MADSLARAARVCRGALGGVTSLFDSVRDGQAVPMSTAQRTVHELFAMLERDADALISLVRLKQHDEEGHMHSIAVAALAARLARQMGLGEREQRQAALAGLLHDIGKALVPLELLAKPGWLTREECATVRIHALCGARALRDTGGVDDAVSDAVHHHHERPDGSGYPDRLSGAAVSRLARMVSVCDVYDAITSNRPYKNGWDPAAAMLRMRAWARDGQFDPAVLHAFRGVVGPYPVGSLVRLRSEQLAVVSAQAPGSPLLPAVTAFYCTRTHRSTAPRVIPLHQVDPDDGIVGVELNSVWRFNGLDRLWAGELAGADLPAVAYL